MLLRISTTLAILFLGTACGGASRSMDEPARGEAPAQAATQDIVDIAAGNADFETLVAAVKAAGLVDTLKGPGPFTVFAPTDDAFAKLPPGTVEGLLADKAALTKVLTYHVVAGKVTSTQVAGLDRATTLAGQDVRIDTSSGVTIDDARVIIPDLEATNGVIHVIDTVLLPK
jgi:uncharacterized surface protein with fasciclin (FAS1) repeats